MRPWLTAICPLCSTCAVNGGPVNHRYALVHAWEVGLVGSHLIPLYSGCVRVCVMAGEYEPAERNGHVAAAVKDKVYVWGGRSRRTKVSHDGPDKTDIILRVNILDVKVRPEYTDLSRIGFHSTR